MGHEEPLRLQVRDEHRGQWHAAAAPSPTGTARCRGPAAQLAAVHRSLRLTSTTQLEAGSEIGKGRDETKPVNRTGLPDRLKSGIEQLSGGSLDGVKVHRNSPKPAQLNAHAYAQGSDIHLAPGQERHLPHEAWHVVQQAQGRVKPTLQAKGVAINDDAGLEREADMMGAKAAAGGAYEPGERQAGLVRGHAAPVRQRGVIQEAKATDKVFDEIDKNKDALAPLSGIHTKRIFYWNSLDFFETENRSLNLKALKRARDKKMPIESEEIKEGGLPEFMQVRKEFGENLPAAFGAGRLTFRKRPEFRALQGNSGWISDNIYWTSATKKIRYMIHAILAWNLNESARNEPNPHLTLRNAATQVDIDLDITNPRSNNQGGKRAAGMIPTRNSYSQGLGNNERKKGESMADDNEAFADLTSDETKTWLGKLTATAQGAREREQQ